MRTRQRLYEHFARDWNNNRLPLRRLKLTEGEKVVEANGQRYTSTSGYEVPIWRLDEKNQNGRVYSRRLGEKIVDEGQKTFNLADHPDGDGSVKDIVAVSMNPHIQEGTLYADCYFVDDAFQEKVERIIEQGVGLGVSSSAFGEVGKDGRVQEDSFELERFFDFVVSPSYEVYLTAESKPTNEQLISNNTTNIIENNESNDAVGNDETKQHIEENVAMSEEKKTSLEEKNLRIGARNLLREAENTENLHEKRKVYEELLEYCNGEDVAQEFIDKATEGMQAIDEELHQLAEKGRETDTLREGKESAETQLQEKENEVDELKKQVETLTEKLEVATNMLDESKDRDQKLKEMYQTALAERNGMVKASEYRELYSYTEEKEEENKELQKQLREMKKRLRREGASPKRRRQMEQEEKSGEEEDEEEEPRSPRKSRKEGARSSLKERQNREQESTEVEEAEEDEEPEEDEGDFSFKQNDRVREYYEDLVAENPEVKRIKKYILNAKTIVEAQRAYLDLKDLVEDIPSPNSRKYEVEGVDDQDYDTDVELSNGDRIDEGSSMNRILKQRQGRWL